MAHNLTINRLGQTEFFYVGESPWHNLGTRLGKVATSEEALRAARLTWRVKCVPVYAEGGRLVSDRRATVRTDTEEPLGVVGSFYTPIQNEEAFVFMDSLVGEAAAMYHTAGSLREGRKVWALAKLPQDLVVVPDDVLHKFLLLLNSHDGSTALVCRFVATRVVCENTLNAALAERGNARQVIVRHTRGAPVRVDEARRVLGIGLKYFDVFGERCRALSSEQLDREMLRRYFEVVFPYPRAGHNPEPTRKLHEVLAFLFEKGRGNELRRVKGSLWAAYNAVTEYVDHVRGVTPAGVPRANWEESALFGGGDEIKRRAFDSAIALLGS